jgi:hypothetical protein
MNLYPLKTLKFPAGILLLLTTTLILSDGCTERIDISLDDTYTRLVVDGRITNDTGIHKVLLSTTSDFYYDEPAPAVSGALVSISDGTNNIALHENPMIPGSYETDTGVFGIPGRTYALHIVLKQPINNISTYDATCEMKAVSGLDSIGVSYNERWRGWEIQCYALDPPSTNFYMFNIFKNHKFLTDTINEVFVSDDRFYNGSYTNGATVGFLRKEKSGEIVNKGDLIGLQIAGITKEYYHFILDLQAETGYKNPLFGGPPANVIGNISNGAIGFFAAYSVNYSSTLFK